MKKEWSPKIKLGDRQETTKTEWSPKIKFGDRQEIVKIENINEIYRHIMETDARIVICYGGRDSGKSYFVGGQYIPSLLCAEEYFRGVAVRKVFATHRDSCYQEVVDGLDVLEEQEDARIEREEHNAMRRAKRKIKIAHERNEDGDGASVQEGKAGDADEVDIQEGKAGDADKADVQEGKAGDVDEADIQEGKAGDADGADIQGEKVGDADEVNIQNGKADGTDGADVQEGKAGDADGADIQEGKADGTDGANIQEGRADGADKPRLTGGAGDKPEESGIVNEADILEGEMEKVDVSKLNEGIKTFKSPLEIVHENGNKLIFRGLDRPKKLKSLKGLNFVWVEEAEDLTREEFYELLLLLRGEGTQQIVLTFNPVDEEHFSNGMFVECPADEVIETMPNGDKKVWIKYLDVEVEGKGHRIKALCLRTTYEDNAYISLERKAAIEQLKKTDPFLYEVYRLGKFGTRGGRILTNIEEVDLGGKGLEFANFDNSGYAQDFGYNHANCILALCEKDNNLYVFEELYGHEKDTAEWIDAANRRGIDKRLQMVCDSAEPDRIKTWVRAGYRAVGVKKYAGSVNGQIDRLKRYERIYIDKGCVNTLREAREWKWKQNKRGRFVDEPQNCNDDAMAALRYSVDLFGERAHNAGMKTVSARKRK